MQQNGGIWIYIVFKDYFGLCTRAASGYQSYTSGYWWLGEVYRKGMKDDF